MSSQPTDPQYIPRDDEDLTPAPENVEENNEGGLVIDDTPVIDATQIDPAAIQDTTAPAADVTDGAAADVDEGAAADTGEGAMASRSDVPVEPIPPVSDPDDDPVVAAAESEQ